MNLIDEKNAEAGNKMNGAEACSAIIKAHPQLEEKIIILSGTSDPGDLIQIKNSGAHFFKKPISDVENFWSKVKQIAQ